MHILVTGGAGFIGSNFVRYWMDSYPNDQMTVVDALTYAGHMENLVGYNERPNFRMVHADINEYDVMREAMNGVDLVVHFAAETHVDRSLGGLDMERAFYRSNIEGTATLLHAAKDAGVKHFHHVSTDEVFGDLDFDASEIFHEEFAYNPHSPYAVSKAASDYVVRGFGHTHHFPVTISNCTNNYGPYQTPEKMIPRSIALLLNGQKLKLYTDADGIPGRNVRDWLHVQDHCEAIDRIIRNGKVGETYCVGGNSELSNYQLVETLLDMMSEITGDDYSIDTHVEYVSDRPGHDRRYAMDTSKMKNELDWQPRYTFADGFLDTVRWYTSPDGKAWLDAMHHNTTEVRADQEKVVSVNEAWKAKKDE